MPTMTQANVQNLKLGVDRQAVTVNGDVVAKNKILGDQYNVDGDLKLTLNADASGNFVQQINIRQKIIATPKDRPVFRLPRPFSKAIGRKSHVIQLNKLVSKGEVVQVYGRSGIGKTTLSRILAHAPLQFHDGIIYFDFHFATADDILLALFETFYEASKWVPSPAQVQTYLKDKRAVVIVDNLKLDEAEMGRLLNGAPMSMFLFLAENQTLLGEGQALHLKGLPPAESVALFQREAKKRLSNEDLALIRRMVMRLEGHPGDILRAAQLYREDKASASVLLRWANPETFATFAANQAVDKLGPSAEDILELLAAFKGISLDRTHIEDIVGVDTADAVLQELEARHLITQEEDHKGRYAIAGGLFGYHAQAQAGWMSKSITFFKSWAEAFAQNSEVQSQALDALLKAAEWGFQNGHLNDSIQIAQQVNNTLIQAKRWGYSKQLLNQTLNAARSIGNQSAASWALHQTGTMVLLEKDLGGAKRLFEKALRLRRQTGNRPGSLLTEYHLRLIRGIPPIIGKRRIPKSLSRYFMPAFIGGLIGLGVLLFGNTLPWLEPNEATPIAYLSPIPTSSPTETVEPTLTATDTSTSVPSLTPAPTATDIPTLQPPPVQPQVKAPPPNLVFDLDVGNWLEIASATEEAVPAEYQLNLVVIPRGGTAPYTYRFGELLQVSPQYTLVAPACSSGRIITGVTSADGQVATFPFTYNAPCPSPPPEIAELVLIPVTDALGDGVENGVAVKRYVLALNVTGGEAPYEYFLKDGDKLTLLDGNSYLFSTVPCEVESVTLTAVVRSADGQEDTKSITQQIPCDILPLTIDEVSLIWGNEIPGSEQPTIESSNQISDRAIEGSFSIVASGGKPPYQYFLETRSIETGVASNIVPQTQLNELPENPFSFQVPICLEETGEVTAVVKSADGQEATEPFTVSFPCPKIDFTHEVQVDLNQEVPTQVIVTISMNPTADFGPVRFSQPGVERSSETVSNPFVFTIPVCSAPYSNTLTMEASNNRIIEKTYTVDGIPCPPLDFTFNATANEYETLVTITSITGGDGNYQIELQPPPSEQIDDYTFVYYTDGNCSALAPVSVTISSGGFVETKQNNPCPVEFSFERQVFPNAANPVENIVSFSVSPFGGEEPYRYFHNGEETPGREFTIVRPACDAIEGTLEIVSADGRRSTIQQYRISEPPCTPVQFNMDVSYDSNTRIITAEFVDVSGGNGTYTYVVETSNRIRFVQTEEKTFILNLNTLEGDEICRDYQPIIMTVNSSYRTESKEANPCPQANVDA